MREILGSIGNLPGELQPRARRSWNRLSDEARNEVAVRYEAGNTTTQLASDYGVSKSTIVGILRERNVVVRRQALRPEQVSDAAQLYAEGLPLSQVAARLRVNQETMRVAIIAAGVQMRPATRA